MIKKLLNLFKKDITEVKRVKVDYIRHEALHTSNVFLEMVEDHLRNHHYYHSEVNPKFNAELDEALSNLCKVYSSINEDNEISKTIANPFYIESAPAIPSLISLFNPDLAQSYFKSLESKSK